MTVSTATAAPAVHIEQLCHTYPARRPARRSAATTPTGTTVARPALSDVSFDIRPGEIFGILGPNGGGKTTLFRILSTMMQPDSGSVEIFGDDVLRQPAKVRTHLGVVFQYPSIDGKLTAEENLHHQGKLYGLGGADLRTRIETWLTRFHLNDRRGHFVEQFSGGMRRRVELAKAMLHEPRLLLLDEPDTGLDPGARNDLWRQLQTLRTERGMTIVLTTHLMEQADRCDRLAVLSEGRLVALDTPANLKSIIGGDVITVVPSGDVEALRTEIETRFGPWPNAALRIADNTIRMERRHGPAFIATLNEALGEQIRSITVGQPTLQDVFLHLTGHTLWGPSEA
jgi:ABC-2 type transport system ATP-binding protein